MRNSLYDAGNDAAAQVYEDLEEINHVTIQRQQIEEEQAYEHGQDIQVEGDIWEDDNIAFGWLREIPECEEDDEIGSSVCSEEQEDEERESWDSSEEDDSEEDDDLPDVPDEASSVLEIDAAAYDSLYKLALHGQSRGLLQL